MDLTEFLPKKKKKKIFSLANKVKFKSKCLCEIERDWKIRNERIARDILVQKETKIQSNLLEMS